MVIGVSTTAGSGNTGTLNAVPVGNYSIQISAANGCTTTSQLHVNVGVYVAHSAITSTNACYGATNGFAFVTAPTSFSPGYSYSWSPGSYTTQSLSGLAPGIYSVHVSDSKGCEVIDTVTIHAFSKILTSISNTFVPCFGGTITTVINSTGGSGPSYHYTINNTPMASTIIHGLSAGLQTVVTRDNYGCVGQDTIRVFEAPQHIIIPTIVKPSCPGNSDGSVYVTVSGNATYTYTWYPVASSNASLTNIVSGNYTLSITDASFCITRSVITVATASAIVAPIPLIKKENCSAGDGAFTLTISGGTPPYTYTTFPINSTNSIVSSLSSDSYTTVINDAKGCIDSLHFFLGNLSTVTLSLLPLTTVLCYNNCTGSVLMNAQNATHPITYSVSGVSTTTNNIVSNLCSGFYFIKVIDAIGCPAWDTINFPSPPVFSYSAAVPPTICYSNTVSLNAMASGGSGGHTFIWNPGNIYGASVTVVPGGTTVYSLNVYDSHNCTLAPYLVKVNVNPQIDISINSSNTGICPGTTAQITPTVTGGDGAYTYTWFPGNSNGNSVFVENLTVPVYSLSVADGCGSPTTTKLISIKIFPVIKPTFINKGDSGCVPFCTKFINTTPNSQSVIWNYGDKPFEEIGDTTEHCYQKPGSYNIKLTVKDLNSCKTSFTYTNVLNVLGAPETGFVTDPGIVTLNEADDVLIKNTSSNATSFKWYYGNKFLSTGRDLNYTFPDTGRYDFKLITMNENHCTDSLEKTICVFEGFNFYMPSAFSPNGDGHNDVLLPKGTGWLYENYVFEVYNRWGIKVFRSTDVFKGWDGGFEEDPYDPDKNTANKNDVYTWRVFVRDNMQTDHQMKGAVMVLR